MAKIFFGLTLAVSLLLFAAMPDAKWFSGAAMPPGPPTIVSVTPISGTFTGGAGSANVFIASMVASLNPASPPFFGTWSISGANAGQFKINATTGDLTVCNTAPSCTDLAAGSYNINVIATQAGAIGSPFTRAVSITGNSAGSPLTNGTYIISSGANAIDGSYGWAGQTPRVQMFQLNEFGQLWAWDGSKFSNTVVAGGGGSIPSTESFLADANNGTVTETNPGDTWTIILVSGSTYKILNNRTGLYLSLSAGVLGMSSTQTVWTIAPQLIQGVALSNSTFTPSVVNGTVGTVTVNMIPSAPAFSGSRSITGTNSGGFHFSGSTLQESTSGGTAAGTYADFNIVVTQAGIANSPQQISPTVTGGGGGGGGGTPPAPAVVAGFTTAVIAADFTQPHFANPATWLDCAGASNPEWWKYIYIIQNEPCATVVNDGGVQAVRYQIIGSASPTLRTNGFSASPIGSGTCPSEGKCFPATSFYMEGTIRAPDFTQGAYMNAPWAAQGQAGCTMEWDSFETFDDSNSGFYYSDGGFHYCNQSTKFLWDSGPPPNPPPGFNVGQYHRYGMRVTTNGTNIIYQCIYIDDISQGCHSFTAGDSLVTQGMITNPEQITAIASMGSVPVFNGTFTHFLKSIYVWSCSNYLSATAVGGCATSNPNP